VSKRIIKANVISFIHKTQRNKQLIPLPSISLSYTLSFFPERGGVDMGMLPVLQRLGDALDF